MQVVVIHNHLAPLSFRGVLLLEVRQTRDGLVRWNVFGDLDRLGSPGDLLGGPATALGETNRHDGSGGKCNEGKFHEGSSEKK
jgi:hypothetical protein